MTHLRRPSGGQAPRRQSSGRQVQAVFFDVDFTLIYPGPTFQSEGYERFARDHGMVVDRSRFEAAVTSAAAILEDQQEHIYDADIFVRYTGRILEEMGARGPRLEECARHIYDEWAACQHFFLYDDVAPALRDLAGRGFKLGLITNSHRPLDAFQEHFELQGLITGAVSSSDHGFMKPHPSIFESALQLLGVEAGRSVMVGDSFTHDIAGAQSAGMRGVLVHRSNTPAPERGVPVVRNLLELPRVLADMPG
jgi:putative hydrolase of the HAD superfamily